VSTGAEEDDSSLGRVRAAGFYHVTARSRLAGVLKLMNRFIYAILWQAEEAQTSEALVPTHRITEHNNPENNKQ
jgi:hypothetical protein